MPPHLHQDRGKNVMSKHLGAYLPRCHKTFIARIVLKNKFCSFNLRSVVIRTLIGWKIWNSQSGRSINSSRALSLQMGVQFNVHVHRERFIEKEFFAVWEQCCCLPRSNVWLRMEKKKGRERERERESWFVPIYKLVFLTRPSQDVFLLPLLPWIEQGSSILVVTLLYDLCDGLTILSYLLVSLVGRRDYIFKATETNVKVIAEQEILAPVT